MQYLGQCLSSRVTMTFYREWPIYHRKHLMIAIHLADRQVNSNDYGPPMGINLTDTAYVLWTRLGNFFWNWRVLPRTFIQEPMDVTWQMDTRASQRKCQRYLPISITGFVVPS